MRDEAAGRILVYGWFVMREAEEAALRGAPGRWLGVQRRVASLTERVEAITTDAVASERRALTAAFAIVRPESRVRLAALTERSRLQRNLTPASPWASLDPTVERASDREFRADMDRAEATLLATIGEYRRTGRFAQLDEVAAALRSMVTIVVRREDVLTPETYRDEAECLERSLVKEFSPPACHALIRYVRDYFPILTGMPDAVAPRDPPPYAGLETTSWITAGGWLPRAEEPDVGGRWFVGDVQRRFRADQRRRMRSIEKQERERLEVARTAEAAERARVLEAQEQKRKARADADAAAAAQQGEDEQRRHRLAEERAAKERQAREEGERRLAVAAADAKALAAFQEEQDRRIDAVIAADLVDRGIEPTPYAIKRERKARGANRPTGGYVDW
jgi:hypothetical protein